MRAPVACASMAAVMPETTTVTVPRQRPARREYGPEPDLATNQTSGESRHDVFHPSGALFLIYAFVPERGSSIGNSWQKVTYLYSYGPVPQPMGCLSEGRFH